MGSFDPPTRVLTGRIRVMERVFSVSDIEYEHTNITRPSNGRICVESDGGLVEQMTLQVKQISSIVK